MSSRHIQVSVGALQDFFAGDDVLIIDEKSIDSNEQAAMADLLKANGWFLSSSDYDDPDTAKPYIEELRHFGCEILMPWDIQGSLSRAGTWGQNQGAGGESDFWVLKCMSHEAQEKFLREELARKQNEIKSLERKLGQSSIQDQVADMGIVDWAQKVFKHLDVSDVAVIAGLAVAHLNNGEKA